MAARLFVADDKFPDVIAQLLARGWTRFPHDAFPNYDLRWTNYAKIAWPRVRAHQIVNHFHEAVVLSRKNELAARLYGGGSCLEADSFFPRTLDLARRGDKEKLVAWFLYARAVGVVRAVLEQATSSVRGDEIRAAMAFLKRVLQVDGISTSWSAKTVDISMLEIESDQWTPLKRKRGDATEKTTEHDTIAMADYQELEAIVHQLRELDSQLECIAAGHGDVWICKPSNLSQGRGIHLLTDLDALLRLAPSIPAQAPTKATSEHRRHDEPPSVVLTECATPSWVVQKYVERPLLLQQQSGRTVHKFDVRQWVLITSLDPLTVYWYKDCYLRFCAHAFTLEPEALSDSFTHLSNYSIQKDATMDASSETHDSFESMWLSSRFRDLLCRDHKRDVWNETILPQMKNAALAAIKAALLDMRSVGRGFEWLGIDFLIDASFNVWLLEVNVSPDVSHSTEVTASLVPDATRGVLDLVLLEEECKSEQTANGWIKMNTS